MPLTNKVQAGDGDPRHGLYSTYVNHCCRCDLCKETQRWKQAEYRGRLRSSKTPEHVHGTVNGYQNYGCRCRSCTSAQAAASRESSASRSAELERLRAENAALKAQLGERA